MQPSQDREKIQFMTQFSILLALEAVFCFTPLGSLPALGPIVATLAMIPVVITAVLLGVKAGTAMGFCAGLFSFLVWTFMPPPQSLMIAFVFTPLYSFGDYQGNFWSLVICFVPRILTGTVAALAYKGLSRAMEQRKSLACAIAGVLGSLVNTLGVTGGIYLFFGRSYAEAIGTAFELMLTVVGGTILFSGIPEAVLCGLAAMLVCPPIKKFILKNW